METGKLILVKHSLPQIVLGMPASQWQLSAEGRERCTPLAEKLAPYGPAAIVSSQEPKAVETAQIVAARLGLEAQSAPGLHEHVRPAVTTLDQAAFQASVAAFFARPQERVFGEESAEEALERFSAALAPLLERHAAQTLAVVAHGTVITLFVARANSLEPYPFWERLGLPSFVVLSRPNMELLSITESVLPAPT